MLGWRSLHRWCVGRGQRGGAIPRRSVRTMDGTRKDIRGRHCGSPGCGGAEQRRVAERTLIGLLSARVMRGSMLQAAELSWVCRRATCTAGGVYMDDALGAASADW